MIRVTCPNCGSKLNAKDELAGQTRKCPKCAQPVKIVADVPAAPIPVQPADPPPSPHAEAPAEERLPTTALPERLSRASHYLICDKQRVVAMWENNGSGWMFKAGSGFISARRARENLPAQGDFKLVELKLVVEPDGKRLEGLASYQLATRWALTSLDQGDDAIAGKITGLGSLNRDQKNAVRQAMKEQFMREVWEHATNVLDYLASADYHSHGIG
jgi:hypothetical protein